MAVSEKEKMLSGEFYDSSDLELKTLREKAHRMCLEFNGLYDTDKKRETILSELLDLQGENIYFQGPVQFDYGCFTKIGKNFYANFNFTCLDSAPVTIGENVFVGPNVSIYTPLHPLSYKERNQYLKADGGFTCKESAKPVVIGDNCWLGGSVVVCPGVTIGAGCVIGAGAVVTKDMPAGFLCVGNPCKPIRKIE
ncbi:MAG: sugar O-acetyltransferase [Treponemataceae bacterium]